MRHLQTSGHKLSVNLNFLSEAVRSAHTPKLDPRLNAWHLLTSFGVLLLKLLTFLTNPNDSKRYYFMLCRFCFLFIPGFLCVNVQL